MLALSFKRKPSVVLKIDVACKTLKVQKGL
jgi:hypothetical protein